MSILSRYGIKEVADVTFYELDRQGNPGAPVLFLDTLKVSNIEQTAETASARGGKGNAELIMWDYGKEISLSIEDALFSPKSMAMMFGVDINNSAAFGKVTKISKTVKPKQVKYDKDQGGKIVTTYFMVNNQKFQASEVKYYGENGNTKDASGKDLTIENAVYVTGDIDINGQQMIVSADKFPGTYYVTGSTYARSETTGQDELFEFIIPKAKLQSEVTLTMEAEGDPSTFSMNLKVLRPGNGEMMKLVKYQPMEQYILTGTVKLNDSMIEAYYGNYAQFNDFDYFANGSCPNGDIDWEFNSNGTLTLRPGKESRGTVLCDFFVGAYLSKQLDLTKVTKIIIDKGIEHINYAAFQLYGINSYTAEKQKSLNNVKQIKIGNTVWGLGVASFVFHPDARLDEVYFEDFAGCESYENGPMDGKHMRLPYKLFGNLHCKKVRMNSLFAHYGSTVFQNAVIDNLDIDLVKDKEYSIFNPSDGQDFEYLQTFTVDSGLWKAQAITSITTKGAK